MAAKNPRKITWKSGRVTWQAFYVDATGRRRSQNFDTQTAAKTFITEQNAQVARGTWIDPDAARQSFGAFADEEWAPAQDWKASTREAWTNVRKRLDWAGVLDLPLGAFDQLKLKAVRQTIRGRYAHSTTNNTMGWVSMVLGAAAANGRIPKNPAEGLAPLRARDGESDGVVTEQDVPTTAEVLDILGAAKPGFRLVVALGLTGLRRGEILGLSADRVDLDTRLVTIDRQLARVENRTVLTGPKYEKVRQIMVPPVVALELRRHVRDHYDPARIWTGEGGPAALLLQGRPGTAPCVNPQQMYDSWRATLAGAGLDRYRYKPHALRHYAASSMLAAGADIATVAGHLGDTVEVVSRIYAHWLRDQRHVPADVLERILTPAAAPLAVAR